MRKITREHKFHGPCWCTTKGICRTFWFMQETEVTNKYEKQEAKLSQGLS